MAWMRMMGADSVGYHERTVLGREEAGWHLQENNHQVWAVKKGLGSTMRAQADRDGSACVVSPAHQRHDAAGRHCRSCGRRTANRASLTLLPAQRNLSFGHLGLFALSTRALLDHGDASALPTMASPLEVRALFVSTPLASNQEHDVLCACPFLPLQPGEAAITSLYYISGTT